MNPIILQNQALYLTTLYERPDVWLKCRNSTCLLLKNSNLNHSKLKLIDKISLKAASDILENEISELDKKHKVNINDNSM